MLLGCSGTCRGDRDTVDGWAVSGGVALRELFFSFSDAIVAAPLTQRILDADLGRAESGLNVIVVNSGNLSPAPSCNGCEEASQRERHRALDGAGGPVASCARARPPAAVGDLGP